MVVHTKRTNCLLRLGNTMQSTCMVYEDVQPEMPIKVDLQVTNPDNFSPSDSLLDG